MYKVIKWIKSEWRDFISARKEVERLKIRNEYLVESKATYIKFCHQAFHDHIEQLIDSQDKQKSI